MEVMHEYEASVLTWEEKVQDFNKAYGLLNISQQQAALKRISWELHWLSADGKEETYTRNYFLHEKSLYWEQYARKDFSFLDAPSEGE